MDCRACGADFWDDSGDFCPACRGEQQGRNMERREPERKAPRPPATDEAFFADLAPKRPGFRFHMRDGRIITGTVIRLGRYQVIVKAERNPDAVISDEAVMIEKGALAFTVPLPAGK